MGTSHKDIITKQTTLSSSPSQVVVVMLPLPPQGHINPLLHLSSLIVSCNIPLYFVGSTSLIRQAKSRDQRSTKNDPMITYQELATPEIENPNPDSSTKFPGQLLPAIFGTKHLREPFYSFVKKLSSAYRKVVIILDYFMSHVAQDIRSFSNVEAYRFHVVSAFASLSYVWHANGRPCTGYDELDNVLRTVPSIDKCLPLEFIEYMRLQASVPNFFAGDITNTSRVFEGLHLDLLTKKKIYRAGVWAIGPLNLSAMNHEITKSNDHDEQDYITEVVKPHHRCLDWLEKQESSSVIYVSFGTTASFSDKEVKEIAMGLEKSEKKFIWVLRYGDKSDVFSGDQEDARKPLLELGFEERVKERGIVVRDWAPQLDILQHPSTGGFMSHCGWNSCTESISYGVPMVTLPLHSEQPAQSILMTKVLKIGIEVVDWAHQCREGFNSDNVEKAVRTLMETKEGNEMRKRAKELSCVMKESLMEGGNGRKETDELITAITSYD